MQNKSNPMFLLSNSQLLFENKPENGNTLIEKIKEILKQNNIKNPKAAYIGASNGDNKDYYSIFEGFMSNLGIEDYQMITSFFPKKDKEYLQNADLILLAGGDIDKGMNILNSTGMKEIIVKKYFENSIIIGISAGAVQLGTYGLKRDPDSEFLFKRNLIDTIKMIPFVISVHEEKEDWHDLKTIINLSELKEKGIGIQSGGGMIYYPDHTVEPIKHALYEFMPKENEISSSLIFPKSDKYDEAEILAEETFVDSESFTQKYQNQISNSSIEEAEIVED